MEPATTEKRRPNGTETPQAYAAGADPFADAAQCLNCGASLSGIYCAACGQKRVRRLTVRSLVADAFRAVAKIDSRFLNTVVGMTLRPGQTARAYIEGKRWSYLNPIKYILFTTTLFLLLINVFDLEVWRLSASTDAGRAQFMLVFGLLAYLIFVNALGPAVVQRVAFRKRMRNLTECYVFMLFCYGHLVLFFIVAAFLGAYNSFANYSGVVVGTIVYLAWALVGFYRTRVWWAGLTAFFMAISYYMMGALMTFLVRFTVNVLR